LTRRRARASMMAVFCCMVSCSQTQVSGTGRSRKLRYGWSGGTDTLLCDARRRRRSWRQVPLESIGDCAGMKQLVHGGERWRLNRRRCGGYEIGPLNGNLGPAMIRQNQDQVTAAALVQTSEHGQRLAVKRVMRTCDGDPLRVVLEVGSV
jgi:hypothetical protein